MGHHFNARAHFRTQTAEDIRRNMRRAREMRAALDAHGGMGSAGAGTGSYDGKHGSAGGDLVVRFLVVTGILLAAGSVAGLLRWPYGPPASDQGPRRARQRHET